MSEAIGADSAFMRVDEAMFVLVESAMSPSSVTVGSDALAPFWGEKRENFERRSPLKLSMLPPP